MTNNTLPQSTSNTREQDTRSLIVEKAYRAFFTPSAHKLKPSARKILEHGRNFAIPFPDGELAVTTWGEAGPTVLLMHGWGGARGQMTGFVEPLLSAGYRVAAFDQPGHGDTGGGMTNILEITATMEQIDKNAGPFEAVIAHSFGTLATSYALVHRDFTQPKKLVYFGAFNRLMDSLPRFQALAGLPDEVIAGLRSRIYADFGEGVLDAIVNESLVKEIDIPAMMFHDTADRVTPIEDSRAVAAAWPGVELIETDGLGHRAFRDPNVSPRRV